VVVEFSILSIPKRGERFWEMIESLDISSMPEGVKLRRDNLIKILLIELN